MPELIVDGRRVRVPEGATLLDAARALGRPVPTLCYGPDLPHHTSCLVCLVEDLGSGRLVPACATPVSDGQEVRTEGPRVLAARRKSVELLLSEHAGDCEAPCVRACPAHADIPGMIRRLQRGDAAGARRVLWERLPLAGALAYVCPAPCERSCRRALLDAPVGIRGLQKAVVEAGLGADAFRPDSASPFPSGRRVAVVGAGPAGLAASCFLARAGHRCRLFDEHPEAGGALRYEIGPDRLPRPVLEADLDVLRRLGVEFVLGQAVRGGPAFEELRAAHDAVVLAVGSPARLAEILPAATAFDPDSGACALPGLFAGGNAVARQPSRLAVRAVAAGRRLARAAGLFLEGRPFAPERPRFDSRLGPVAAGQQARCAAEQRPPAAPTAPAGGPAGAEEAARCLRCDCARKASCGLRALADELGADRRAFRGEEARPFERRRGGRGGARGLSFEPGKCIKCGLCVRIAERGGDRPGLAFTGRGFDLGLRVPFNEDIDAALAGTAAECAARCPTGALIWNRR